MDVKEIITHLSNFQDTWKGWDKVISGLTDFFGGNPIQDIADLFANDAEKLKGAFEPLSSLSSNN
ncbi:hypothetical protein KBP53_09945 [Corynebacterium genitalium ATCC 33030]|uniref:Uncharacterized protein n=1 Tax=Corynebacterium genitalium ATCC 33030 TaxID=585529 RepID=D7W9W9_9CORY|nr:MULTISPECIES: hypothetical protein [Corynebacterium]EFK55586.1 hypothetical protein HMPREF0291_10844 [Corynebacterium genitalium ATCC 33030]MCQ4621292.1 hypothetical protein [Corynebacterium sp. CCUG 71335]MCQ4627391.1 hypothetical protein [Corynebacterium sp. CCUG 65737]UUA89190.1 hypothetical protein KBP53_09945 [Corynebacterium genitalium ATCC 33030]